MSELASGEGVAATPSAKRASRGDAWADGAKESAVHAASAPWVVSCKNSRRVLIGSPPDGRLVSRLRLPQDLETERVVRAPLQEPLEDLDGFAPPARAQVGAGQRHVGRLEGWAFGQRPLEHRDRALGVALGPEDEGEVVGGFGVAGPLRHRLLEVGPGLVEVALPAEEDADVVEGLRKAGLQGQGLLVQIEGLRELARLGEREAQVVE